jgi:YVTN family beta-propeller protein
MMSIFCRVAVLYLTPLLLFPVAVTNNAKAQNAEPRGTLISRQAIAADPVIHKVYAVDVAANAVWVIDTVTRASVKVQVGGGPIAVVANQATGMAYVMNTDSGTVSVVNGRINTVVATVRVGERPYVIAADPVTNKVFVANIYTDMATMIDGATSKATKLKLASADAIAINSKTGSVYLLGYEGANLTVFREADGSVRKASAGAIHLWGMIVDESRNRVYVTRIGSNELAALNETNHKVTPIPTGSLPCAVAENPATNMIYVANYGDDSVTVIDGKRLAVITTVHVGKQPHELVVDPKSGLVYVANTHGDSVSVIDGHTNTVLTTLPAGRSPYALALDPQTDSLYAANMGEPAFTRIGIRQLSSLK